MFKRISLPNISLLILRTYSNLENVNSKVILGIETSCDDTGCALINEHGNVLSQCLHSQHLIHLRNGGIIPDIAQNLHRAYIEPIVNKTLDKAKLSIKDVTAVAVTTKPGLPLSLSIGLKYAKHLASHHQKPIIPIHHMEAHALTARMHNSISFPYLVLLISGGHCLLAVVNDINEYYLLGESMDSAPGEVFDKVARRMKLRNIPEYSQICGGRAIELAASKAKNPNYFMLPLPLAEYKDCNFSFNGLKTAVLLHLHRKEKEHNIVADSIIPEINDLCASFLIATTRHLVHRTQRAIEFCLNNNLLSENRQLVISGGVACNNFIFKGLHILCNEYSFNIFRPPPELCTDNGVMIAWNGLEKWKKNIDILTEYDKLDIEANSPLGISMIEKVNKAKLPTKVIKLKQLLQ